MDLIFWVLLIAFIYIGIPLSYFKKGIRFSIFLAYIAGVLVFYKLSESFFGSYGTLSALIYSAQLFTFGVSGKDLLELSSSFFDVMNIPAIICVWSIYILCPMLTVGAILSYIKKELNRLFIKTKFYRNVYIFSEKNDNAVILAEDICKNDKRAAVIFSADESGKDTLKCFCLNLPIIKILTLLNKTNNVYICFNDTDEGVMLNKLTFFLNSKRDKFTDVYVFSENDIVGEVVDGLKVRALNVQIKVINTKAILVRNLLSDYPLFLNQKSSSELNVTVIGTGGFGGYFASNVLWCGQMPDCQLKLNLVDRECDDYVLRRVSSNIKGGIFDIQSFCENADTISFFESIKNSRMIDSDYIMVSLGNDDNNIKTARELMLFFKRIGKNPFIITILRNKTKFAVLQKVLESEGIFSIGGIETVYSLDNIFRDRHFTRAFEVYKIVEQNYNHDATFKDFFLQKQIDIYSSYANGIHCQYKVHSLMDGNLNANYDEIREASLKNLHKLSSCEHDRWVAFEVLKGYIGVDKDSLEKFLDENYRKSKKIHKDDDLKIHACIASLSEVEKLDNLIEERYGIKQNLKEIDQLIAESTADLWFVGR